MPELTRRYVVMTMATEAPFDPLDPEGVFVLKPWKDPAALRALATYRDNCYPELAHDLDAWIRSIEAGPSVRGHVGRRNEPYVTVAVIRENDTPGGPSPTRPAAHGRAGKRGGRRPTAHGKATTSARRSFLKPQPKKRRR